jgi:hypothetical protein
MRGPWAATQISSTPTRRHVEDRPVEPEEPALVVDRSLRIEAEPDHLERFFQPGDRLGERNPIRDRVFGLTRADPEDEWLAG